VSDSERTVACDVHGRSTPAFVCSHLLDALRARDALSLGFHEGEPDPDHDEPYEPCAWCDSCEEVRVAAGGWNEDSQAFVSIHLVCFECFDSIRLLAKAPAQ
jgi:hypothetical protein